VQRAPFAGVGVVRSEMQHGPAFQRERACDLGDDGGHHRDGQRLEYVQHDDQIGRGCRRVDRPAVGAPDHGVRER